MKRTIIHFRAKYYCCLMVDATPHFHLGFHHFYSENGINQKYVFFMQVN